MAANDEIAHNDYNNVKITDLIRRNRTHPNKARYYRL